MTFLPVVERELRVAARRRGTCWGRFAAGVLGCALLAWSWLAAGGTEQERGVYTLQGISAVIFIYAVVAGTLVTCDCLSEEKREGTLGLLFLTDLKGHDVVLGKLAATSLNIIYGMLAVLPMLAVPFLVGGVDWPEMLRIVVVSLNLLFCFLSIGLFVSALCRAESLALTLAIFIGLALMMGGPALAQIRRFPLVEAANLSSPAAGCFLGFEGNFTRNPYIFWLNVAATQIYGWIFLMLSCWLVRRAWQDEAMGAQKRRGEASLPAARTQRSRALLAANPFLWRVTRSRRQAALVWLGEAGLAVLLLAIMHWSGLHYSDPGSDMVLLVTMGFVLKAWLAMEASRTLSKDRRSGGLELLLTTPLHEREIVRGQAWALARRFGPPAAALVLANLMVLGVEIKRWPSDSRPDLFWAHLILGFFLAADLVALCWCGMWLGLTNRKPNRAVLLALAQIVFLPTIIFTVILFIWGSRAFPDDAAIEKYSFVLWAGLGLAADLYFGLTARRKLLTGFRSIVAEGSARKKRANSAPSAAAAMAEAI